MTEFVNEWVVPRKCLLEVSLICNHAYDSSSSKPPKIGLISTSGLLHNLHIYSFGMWMGSPRIVSSAY